jgi:hypothetical protein
MQRLAQQLRAKPPPLAAQNNLARALRRAQSNEAIERLAQARKEMERLLKSKADDKDGDAHSERLLQKKQRELDKLERENAATERAERQLDSLRRELSSAGERLGNKQPADASEHLDQAARELAKAAQQQLSAERRKQLQQRVQQLREMISKQRSDQGSKAGRDGQPKPGAGGTERLSLDRFVQAASGKSTEAGKAGDAPGKPGQGMLLVPGHGTAPGALLRMPAQEGAGALAGASAAAPILVQSPYGGRGGKPESGRDTTTLDGKRTDTRVAGEQRNGPTRSEVILEAGQHGFASRAYERVHADYQRHAEAILEHDQIPGGYRFYVRRYFQLIRPREVQHE